MSESFVVAIKPSARRTNRAAGTAVNRNGAYQRFESRKEAETWAARLATAEAPVWIRGANPNDRTPADGYLMGRQRSPERGKSEQLPGDQSELPPEILGEA